MPKLKKAARYLGALTLIFVSQNPCKAAEAENSVSASAGIAAPSALTSVFQNPAGLTSADGTTLNALGSSDSSSFSNGRLGAGVLHGAQTYALTGGARYTTVNDGATDAFFGLGVHPSSMKASFGLAGEARIQSARSGSGGDPRFNAGALFELNDQVTLGATAFDLANGPSEWGAGVAYELSSGAALISDLTLDHDASHIAMAPSLRVGDANAALTIGYGMALSGGQVRSAQLRSGFSVGGALKISSRAHWELYYNQLSRYFTGVAFSF